MRVLIDECVDPRVKTLLSDHQPATVCEQGWSSLEDSALLSVAQAEFGAMVTIDRNLEFQQNLSKFRIGLVVVRVYKNQLIHYQALQQELARAVEQVRPGEVIHIG